MQKTFCESCFKMKGSFTLVEVMFANNILLFLVAGFTKTTEQTFKQIQLNNQKTELVFRLDKWTKKAEQYISSRKLPGK